MNKATILTVVVLAAVLVAYVEVRLNKDPEATPPAEKVDLGPLENKLDLILERQSEFREWQAEVDRWRETSVKADAAPTGLAAAAKPADPKSPISKEALARAKQILADVKAGRIDGDEVNELWNVLLGSGLEAEAIAAFDAYVKKNPEDPEGWYGLGVANIQRLRSTQNQLEIMKLSAAGDKAFDAALKLDDRHFGARFSKAFSYTFWPPFLGKGPEAIKHFEVLVERHGSETGNDAMPIVYQSLGSEYLKAGNREKAKAAFERGLETFPDSRVLREQLEAMEK